MFKIKIALLFKTLALDVWNIQGITFTHGLSVLDNKVLTSFWLLRILLSTSSLPYGYKEIKIMHLRKWSRMNITFTAFSVIVVFVSCSVRFYFQYLRGCFWLQVIENPNINVNGNKCFSPIKSSLEARYPRSQLIQRFSDLNSPDSASLLCRP